MYNVLFISMHLHTNRRI